MTVTLALVLLIGCTQQTVNAPASTGKATKLDAKKVNLEKQNKGEAIEIALKKPEAVSNTSNSVESSDGGFGSNSILKMVGSALLTGIISGLVSKALQ